MNPNTLSALNRFQVIVVKAMTSPSDSAVWNQLLMASADLQQALNDEQQLQAIPAPKPRRQELMELSNHWKRYVDDARHSALSLTSVDGLMAKGRTMAYENCINMLDALIAKL